MPQRRLDIIAPLAYSLRGSNSLKRTRQLSPELSRDDFEASSVAYASDRNTRAPWSTGLFANGLIALLCRIGRRR
jgi:hypothetical protein